MVDARLGGQLLQLALIAVIVLVSLYVLLNAKKYPREVLNWALVVLAVVLHVILSYPGSMFQQVALSLVA